MTLEFIIIPTYDIRFINILDISTYDVTPPITFIPTLDITVPGGFNNVSIPFSTGTYNILDSTLLEITEEGTDALPDGIYVFKYSTSPVSFVEKTILRVDVLMQKFDEVFMKLDMMQCDRATKAQEKVQLNTISDLIQGAISSANNCATDQAMELYKKADKLLSRFRKNSACCGGQYLTKFTF